MKKNISRLIYACLALMGLLSSCGEDRSGEYYALIATKTWIYEVMQEIIFLRRYSGRRKTGLFQETCRISCVGSFFQRPKNGYVFSHVDSVLTRATSTYPCFGFEAVLVRTDGGSNALRVLYTEPDSPAEEAGLKRGDWIIAIDNKKISTSDYTTYINRPTKAYSFTLANYNPYPEEVDDPEFNYVEFDTLGTIQMPSPRYVEEQDILKQEQFLLVTEKLSTYYIMSLVRTQMH